MQRINGFILAAVIAVASRSAGGQTKAPGRHPSADAADPAHAARNKSAVGRILGVFDADGGYPIKGAEVIDLFTNAIARTPASGLVGLIDFQHRNDSAVVRIRKIGYSDTALVVMVGATDTIPMQVLLEPVAPTLPKVLTEALANSRLSPSMREFESRRNDKSVKGTFFTPQEMRQAAGRKLDYFLMDKGVRASSRGCRGSVRLFMDGVFSGFGIPEGTTDQFEAAEYYSAAAVPERFALSASTVGRGTTTSDCGVLLLWNRERVGPRG